MLPSSAAAARLGGLLRQPARTACLRSCGSSPQSRPRTRRHFAAVAMGGSAGGQRVVLWFRGTDLRLHDNAPVAEAARRVQSGQAADVVPLFCFDPRFLRASAWGSPKTGNYRAQFLLESVADLKQRLRGIGSDLVVALGKPEDVIPELAAPGRPLRVLAQAEATSEETRVEAAVTAAAQRLGGRLELLWGSTMYHCDDLPFAEGLHDMPDVFTPFKQKVEARSEVRRCLPTPGPGTLPLPAGGLPAERLASMPQRVEDLNAAVPAGHPRLATPQHDARGVLRFEGGEGAALRRLQHYLWGSHAVATYFDTRNGMLGADYSTKFAPWLAHGCLSPRAVYHEIRKYEAARGANKSTGWVIFELTWRDYFHFFALKHGNAIFFPEGTAGRGARWRSDPELLARWKAGRTGWPLVDANMRELAATGFMSNRGRQNVASFLALDLGLDWRAGADHFESLLLDYDVASNWGNWVAAAGLTGGRVNKFNITKQSKDYDPQGDYIRHWCPELARVPASRIHEPWLMSREEQAQCGLQIGVDYPAPIPAKQFAPRPGGGERPGGYRTGGRGGGWGGSGSGRGGGRRGGSSGGGARGPKPRSAYDLYG